MNWKQQALLSIVKLRYGDVPVSPDVSTGIASSALTSRVNIGARGSDSALAGNRQVLGAEGRYTDRLRISERAAIPIGAVHRAIGHRCRRAHRL